MSGDPGGFAAAGCAITDCRVTKYSPGAKMTAEEFQRYDAVLFHLENFMPWPWEIGWINRVRRPSQR